MQCEQVRDYLSAYIDSELETDTSIEVTRHTELCTSCAEELKQLRELSRLFRKGVAEATEMDIPARAGRINAAVLEQIRKEISAKNLISIESHHKPKKNLFKMLSLAATLLMAISASILVLLIYQGGFSGPLLAGASRNHRICDVVEKIGLGGWLHGGSVTEPYGIEPPALDSLGLNLEAAHPCRVNSSRFVHMVYSGTGERASIYYGSDGCVDKLRSQMGDVELGKIYNYSEASVQVSAFTVDERCLWMVAGRITPERLQEITASVQQQGSARAALRLR